MSDTLDIGVHIHARTDLAVLVSTDGDESAAVWLPLSRIDLLEHRDGRTAAVTLPGWLAEDRGLA